MDDFSRVTITLEGKAKFQSELNSRMELDRKTRLELPAREARACGNGSGGHAMTGEVFRQRQIDHDRILELTKLINSAKVAPPVTQTNHVQIGSVASLVYARRIQGKARYVWVKYHIVGYGEGDCDSVPRKIAYDSTLARGLIGLRKDGVEMLFLDGAMRKVRVSNIFLSPKAA